MIFLTLGTYPLSFDRLLVAVDELCGENKITEEVFGQIGHTNYVPKNFQFTHIMEKKSYDDFFKSADMIISHAGMGTISMALDQEKPLLVVPRLASMNEVVNNHQVDTANKFEELGHILTVKNLGELEKRIKDLKDFVPVKRDNQAQSVAERVGQFIMDH